MKVDALPVKDDAVNGIEYIKFLHQTKRIKNVDFHKLKIKQKNSKERTYFYLDDIDMERLLSGHQ